MHKSVITCVFYLWHSNYSMHRYYTSCSINKWLLIEGFQHVQHMGTGRIFIHSSASGHACFAQTAKHQTLMKNHRQKGLTSRTCLTTASEAPNKSTPEMPRTSVSTAPGDRFFFLRPGNKIQGIACKEEPTNSCYIRWQSWYKRGRKRVEQDTNDQNTVFKFEAIP